MGALGVRVYLDHNATTPLGDAARAAMISAMDIVGNPSSVHSEGRAAKGLMEKARQDIAEAMGAGNADIVFVSGATEAAALACAGRGLSGAEVEHEAVLNWLTPALAVDAQGAVSIADPKVSAVQLANSETGILQTLPEGLAVSDVTQGFGKVPFAYSWAGIEMVFASAHKLGGPKGIGVLVIPQGYDLAAQLKGGGQEMGRRAGTENLIGIAGFAAAAKASQTALANGEWARIAELRDRMEAIIADAAPDTIFVGKGAARLPNTSCFVTPGWKGETQVMSMDLAGFAVSAGSACSSGKVKASKVLQAMGFSETDAGNACRVSLGVNTTEDEVTRFAQAWVKSYRKMRARAA
jgi:cysteine desulfurase